MGISRTRTRRAAKPSASKTSEALRGLLKAGAARTLIYVLEFLPKSIRLFLLGDRFLSQAIVQDKSLILIEIRS